MCSGIPKSVLMLKGKKKKENKTKKSKSTLEENTLNPRQKEHNETMNTYHPADVQKHIPFWFLKNNLFQIQLEKSKQYKFSLGILNWTTKFR